MADLLAEFKEVNRGLSEAFYNIKKQYENSSLFLETLLRKSHFDEGRLTLRTKKCNMKEDVILPQLERFSERFAKKGIEVIDAFGKPSDEQPVAVVDVGLMAQVYSNLFSNALKYTREVVTDDGSVKKAVRFGKKRLKDYFGPGKHGTRYDVFSTGPHIPEQERKHVFEEGYRGSGSVKRPGTGHGLAFVKNAVEIHGGTAGYEAVTDGNMFYFILPD
ncbi:MAG: HAMP domain-containing histidine kinase [Deltaproteobacteria bacterium]|nr:HAMP domain-containing histidine kinase [Deltaproteobacteria bacterium]